MNSSTPHVVILGGGYAGLLCASRLARSHRKIQITLVDARADFEQRIRYHEAVTGAVPKTLKYTTVLARRGVRFRQGMVENIDSHERVISFTSANTESSERLHYDYLVLALGSRICSDIPGVESYAWQPNALYDMQSQTGSLDALGQRRGHVAVVGAGLTGLEFVTEIKTRWPGLNVSLISSAPVGQGFTSAAVLYLQKTLHRLGIRVYEQQRVRQLLRDRLVFADGTELQMDACLWTAGFQPSALPADMGLPTDEQGRLLTEDSLQVIGHNRIFAAGDIAHVPLGRHGLRMGCATAMPQGAHAGDNLRRLLNGQSMQPFRFGYFFRCVSLGRRDGLIQYVDAYDQPRLRMYRGCLAALIKEWVCQMTYASIRWELKTGWPLYLWPKPHATDRPVQTHKVSPTVMGNRR